MCMFFTLHILTYLNMKEINYNNFTFYYMTIIITNMPEAVLVTYIKIHHSTTKGLVPIESNDMMI